ncbi:MAG: SMI1/KNR4 family protein [Minicystis sp.]
MHWRQWIVESYMGRSHDVRPEFREGATRERLVRLEDQLGCPLPMPLRAVLEETDGVRESMCHHGTWFEIGNPVWSCDEIAEENMRIRTLTEGPSAPPGMPEPAPLYFANAGVDGILFAFLVCPSGPEDRAVYAYYPIEVEWRRISPTLEAHLRGWKV